MRWTRWVGLVLVAAIGAVGWKQFARSGNQAHIASLPHDPVPMELSAIGLLFHFGVTDVEPTDWSGEIAVQPGQILSLTGWRFGAKDSVEGNRFFVRTRFAGPQQKQIVVPGLFATLSAPEPATVRIATKQGEFSFQLKELTMGERKSFLDGRVWVERTLPSFRITETPTEDDFPAAASDADGNVWMAFVAYTHGGMPNLSAPLPEPPKDFEFVVPKGNGDRILLMKFDGKQWAPPMPVTDAGLDLWKPTVTVDGNGSVWVIWSQNLDGNWDLFARRYNPKGNQWSAPQRLTNEQGGDINAVATTDPKGNVWVAWQGWREGNFDIWLAQLTEKGLMKPQRISTSAANDWTPAIASTSDGAVFVAFDTYDKGNYDVWLAEVRNGKMDRHPIATTSRFEARPHLAVDKQNRVWVTYEEGDASWGKDYAGGSPVVAKFNKGAPLYLTRTVRVKCFAGGKLQAPAADLRANFPKWVQRSISHPRIAMDANGSLWLLFRHATNPDGAQENWMSYAVVYDGERWSAPMPVPQSVNIMDVRPTLAMTQGKTLIALYTSDKRPAGTGSRLDSDVFATVLMAPIEVRPLKLVPITAEQVSALEQPVPPAQRVGRRQARLQQAEGQYTPQEVVHSNEAKDIQRLRTYRLKLAGKTYMLLRGEFHRHTELTAHRDQDGTLEDAWRYALDAASMDWMGLGDHDNGYHSEYLWWLSQKMTDLYNHPPKFIGMFTYERSVPYPDGHRNALFARRGIRPLPRLQPQPDDPPQPYRSNVSVRDARMFYRYLREFDGICASHTSATNMGTDWRDNDPVAEPVVEIYQGLRQNYEHLGAPRSAMRGEESIGGWQPFGFVWNAFAKGYRLGFQCSSDHISTHMSYAVVFAEAPTREAILDAFKKRHSYGATDNILLVVTCGEHLMGDEFTTKEPPKLEIYVVGTAPIAKVHIIKDFTYVYTAQPNKKEVKLTWMDNAAEKGKTSWYYVRVEQADGQIAWGSPMWIRYEP